MEDLIPLLIFAIISAVSHVIQKRKQDKEEVTWEELETRSATQDGQPGPPPVENPPIPPIIQQPSWEAWEKMIREAQERKAREAERRPSPEPVPSSRTMEPPVVPQRKPDPTPTKPITVDINAAYRKARLARDEAQAELESAQKKSASMDNPLAPMFENSEAAYSQQSDLWSNPSKLKDAFIVSLIFDKPLAYQNSNDVTR
ncbi:MAG: hypothetical protein LR011_04270 [Verrucomicrobia bacterium]|nr:hypothetical protein [Verrucomicrobiota bacterium]